MYLQHFGLRELPFTLTPNAHFFLNMASYHKAYNMLMVSLANAEGFIKIVGEVGTGKTMLCRKVLNTLEEDKESYITAYIPNPVLSPKGLFLAFAEELDLNVEQDIGYHRLLKAITEKLVEYSANSKQVVLFIDEAHAMPEQTLEALRLLTNIETEQAKLFQVVLFAQPEIDVALAQPSLRQLRQRITFSFTIESLDREGTERYVVHRLATAGYNGPFLFTRRAVDNLYRASEGIPRVINILCHKALMVAFGRGERTVQIDHVRSAADDTEGVELPSNNYRPAFIAIAGIFVGAALIFYVGRFYL
ncbi:MAG: AAA family ATPase [Gammaproteobacteria bacterium]|jgi:MSHA biogenesis protein MshM|nr:AAA family ATPase [Gammaproteobacteria bacterium]MDP6097186.1 AAA family ATPase [Gammaproteobacteria bacterium]MDP7455664.1 AAA family ATPase [Gammaproteobacteria bacterium]|tara:strand:+ start:1051 stop:1965 length:915 start_codon:yes stop_codon:yes gene_type:complete